MRMKNLTISIDDQAYQLAIDRAAESGTTIDALVREFLAGYCGIEDAGARQAFMQWLRDDAQNAQDSRSANSESRMHVYR